MFNKATTSELLQQLSKNSVSELLQREYLLSLAWTYLALFLLLPMFVWFILWYGNTTPVILFFLHLVVLEVISIIGFNIAYQEYIKHGGTNFVRNFVCLYGNFFEWAFGRLSFLPFIPVTLLVAFRAYNLFDIYGVEAWIIACMPVILSWALCTAAFVVVNRQLVTVAQLQRQS